MDHRKWDDIVQCPSISHRDTDGQDVTLLVDSLPTYVKYTGCIANPQEGLGKQTKQNETKPNQKRGGGRKEDA